MTLVLHVYIQIHIRVVKVLSLVLVNRYTGTENLHVSFRRGTIYPDHNLALYATYDYATSLTHMTLAV